MIVLAAPSTPDFGLKLDLPGTALALDRVQGAGGELWPPEADALPSSAAASRRAEFAAGRTLARRAMAALSLAPAAVPRGEERAPVWPPGLVGSLSHEAELAAAVVSRDLHAVGVDIERIGRMAEGVARLVLTPRERNSTAGEPHATAAFSAKEAAYKAINPLTRRWAGFQDAEVRLDLEASRFEIAYVGRDSANAVMSRLEGAVSLAGGCVLTLAWLRSAPP